MASIRDIASHNFRTAYKLEDKRSALKDIQLILNFIQDKYRLNASGYFDDNTKLSILNFQQKCGINATGTVDQETLRMMVWRYDLVDVLRGYCGCFSRAKPSFPLTIGDTGDYMIILNSVIGNLINKYHLHCRVKASRVFSMETLIAVHEMRKIYLLNDADEIDEELCARLLTDYYSDGQFNR